MDYQSVNLIISDEVAANMEERGVREADVREVIEFAETTGKKLYIEGEEHFLVTARVAVSPQFYAWVLGFGSEAEILGPASVREGLKEHLSGILRLYEN